MGMKCHIYIRSKAVLPHINVKLDFLEFVMEIRNWWIARWGWSATYILGVKLFCLQYCYRIRIQPFGFWIWNQPEKPWIRNLIRIRKSLVAIFMIRYLPVRTLMFGSILFCWTWQFLTSIFSPRCLKSQSSNRKFCTSYPFICLRPTTLPALLVIPIQSLTLQKLSWYSFPKPQFPALSPWDLNPFPTFPPLIK